MVICLYLLGIERLCLSENHIDMTNIILTRVNKVCPTHPHQERSTATFKEIYWCWYTKWK